jgi:DNA-binding NarL/FixJ family response regulator
VAVKTSPVSAHTPARDDGAARRFALGPAPEVFARASAQLRQRVQFDSAGWFAMDPSTLLPTNPTLIENVNAGDRGSFWERECGGEDAMLFRDLARAGQPVSTLRAATDGNPERSTRFREHLSPTGYGDELRGVFRRGDRTWGAVSLLRDRDREPFSSRDVALVARLAAELATELADLARTPPLSGTTVAGGSGTALFEASGALLSIDEQADRWLSDLSAKSTGADPSSGYTTALVSRAVAVAAGRLRCPPAARLRMRSGHWLTLTTARLRSRHGSLGPVAMTIQPAHPAHVSPLLIEAYSLTLREREVTQAVARGLSNAEIAAELLMSPHTVRDHLKVIFGKIDVSSRGELAAKLYAGLYAPVHHDVDSFTHTSW